MATTPVLPLALSAIDYESRDAELDSEYQVCWSNTMDKGWYKNPSTYKKVEVLLLCWADDMATKDEVNRFKSVLEKRFHYSTHTEYLDAMIETKLQLQVNAKVASFTSTHDGPHTLLIVYYAGHGRPGSYYGALEVHGQSSPNDKSDEKKRMDKIVWNYTEELLRPAEAAVLEIFDCCHAGTLALTIRGDKRPFEYLAATKPLAATKGPGKESFTSALIHALEYLIENKAEGRFTTVELLRTITHHSPDFPRNQVPILSDREDMSPGGRIMLHPLHSGGLKPQNSPKESSPPELAKQKTMTLHFDFDEMPPLEDVQTLGMEFNKVFERNVLKVNGIRWGGLKPSVFPRAVQAFLKGHNRRASMRRERESVTAEISDDCSLQCPSEPLTPSFSSKASPGTPVFAVGMDVTNDPLLLSPTYPFEQGTDLGTQSQSRHKRRKLAIKTAGSQR